MRERERKTIFLSFHDPFLFSFTIMAIFPLELLAKTLLLSLILDPPTSGYHLLNVALQTEPVVSHNQVMLIFKNNFSFQNFIPSTITYQHLMFLMEQASPFTMEQGVLEGFSVKTLSQ